MIRTFSGKGVKCANKFGVEMTGNLIIMDSNQNFPGSFVSQLLVKGNNGFPQRGVY